MKNLFVFALFALLFSGCAQRAPKGRGAADTGTGVATGQASSTPVPDRAATHVIVERGPHHRVWQRVTLRTNATGRVTGTTNSFVELQTGMAHLVGSEWVDSREEITLTTNGGEATNGQHNVAFPWNINAAGAVQLTMPDGRRLRSNILGLSYFDTATGNSVMIAELKDSNGQLRLYYPD